MTDRIRPAEQTRSGLVYVGQAAVARHLSVERSAVANWLVRHADVPQPDALVDGRPVWLVERLSEWTAWRRRFVRDYVRRNFNAELAPAEPTEQR